MNLPCEICGPENDCTCPPCACMWCRARRGEATKAERDSIDAMAKAFRMQDQRRALRAAGLEFRASRTKPAQESEFAAATESELSSEDRK